MVENVIQVALNLDGWFSNMHRETTPNRVYYFEHGVDETVQNQLDNHYCPVITIAISYS